MSSSMYCIGRIKGNEKTMVVCEDDIGNTPAKRVNVVSIKMVKESSFLYDIRKINSPADAVELGMKFLEECDREKLLVACLDTKNQINSISTVSVGSLNSSVVHPREVFKTAILSNASSVILFHNHPSGDVTPSAEDINITKRLSEAGKILGINITDHLILSSDGRYTSLKERGVL